MIFRLAGDLCHTPGMGKWDNEHRAAGRAPAVEDANRRAPGRKNTRRWCRGKVGVEHRRAIRLGDNYTYARRVCEQWQPGKRWTRWICCEQEYCTACGKILRHTLGEDCTTRPRT